MDPSKIRIKELRLARGLSQEALGKLVGVSRPQIGNYEDGEQTPSLDVGLRLAAVFGVSPAYMVGKNPDPSIDDRLPDEWVQLVAGIIAQKRTPEEVRIALRLLESAKRELEGEGKSRGPLEP